MANYRKTKRAEHDMEDIAYYGMQRRGVAQALNYQQGLERRSEAKQKEPS